MSRFSVPFSILVAVLASALLAGALPRPTLAQEGLPVTPDPSECTAEFTFDDLLAAVGSPVADSGRGGDDDGDEEGTAPAFALPDGEPADEETVAAITATVREAIACTNTGNFLLVLAFVTDDYVRETSEGEPLTEEDAAFYEATPPPLPEDQYLTLHAVREVRVLGDGRVGALVESQNPTTIPGDRDTIDVDFFIFVEEDGRYLIDESVENLEDQFPPESEPATPEA